MISNSLPLSSSLNAFTPLSSLATGVVRDTSSSNSLSTLKPVAATAETGRTQIRLRTPEQDQQLLNINESGLQGSNVASSESEQREQAETRAQEELIRRQELADLEVINELSARDKEVRAHEQAHAAVGGQYAGAPSYTYERGPNGVRYAVAGEVPIDVGAEATPEETIRKAQIVRRAALAPAEPSPQDRRVAAQASQLEASARQELAIQTREEASATRESDSSGTSESSSSQDSEENSNEITSASSINENSQPASSANSVSGLISSSSIQNLASRNTTEKINASIATVNFDSARQGTLFDGLA